MSETENSSLVKQLRSMHKKKQLIVYLGTHDLNATFNIQSLASRFKFLTFGNRTWRADIHPSYLCIWNAGSRRCQQTSPQQSPHCTSGHRKSLKPNERLSS